MLVAEEEEAAPAAVGEQEVVEVEELEVVQGEEWEVVVAERQAVAEEWGEEIARAPGRVETASALSVKRRRRTRGAHPVIR